MSACADAPVRDGGTAAVAVPPPRRPAVPAARRRPAAPRSRVVAVHGLVAVALAVVWLLAGPVSGPFRNHVAELVGLEAVWLLSSSVLVLTRSQRLERAAGGVGVELWWHRLAGALGLGLGVVHPRLFVPAAGEASGLAGMLNLLSMLGILVLVWSAFLTPSSRAARWRGPLGWVARRGYDRWRSVHRLLAVFVVVSMAHGVVDSRTLLQSPVLLTVYAAVCAVGLLALAERFVLARRPSSWVGACVVSARHHDRTVVLRLLPDRPLARGAGQFVELDVPASRERAHPFSVVSAPDAPFVEVAVQASGPGTARIVEHVAAGDRVRLGAVRGLPDAPATSGRELWLASGIGVTPFVARLRARAAAGTATPVDLVWTRRGVQDAPYVDELLDAARALPWFTLHLRDTSVASRLTPSDVLALVPAPPGDLTVLACGAPGVVRPLVDGLVAAGVRRRAVTVEAFGYR